MLKLRHEWVITSHKTTSVITYTCTSKRGHRWLPLLLQSSVGFGVSSSPFIQWLRKRCQTEHYEKVSYGPHIVVIKCPSILSVSLSVILLTWGNHTFAQMSLKQPWSIYDDVIKWKHFPRNWTFVRGIHRSPVNSPHKGQWRGALMFTLICAPINGGVNNGEAGDLRRYRPHYDVIVMYR